MRMKLATFLAAILVSGVASASCERPLDHVEQRRCSKREAIRLSRDVRVAQQLIRTRIASWDEDPANKSRTLALFNKAATQFRSYQTRQCEFEASAAAGGNGASDIRLSCQITLYGAYLKSLQKQAAWFESQHA